MDGIAPLTATDDTAVGQVAQLHATLLPGSPIPRLGSRFMRRFYYRSLVADDLIHCQISYVAGRPAGFITCTAQPARFMAEGLRRHWLQLGWVMLGEVLADPRRLVVIFWTLNYMRRRPGRPHDPGEGEILSFGVLPEFRTSAFVQQTGRRIAGELFASARAFFAASGISRYRAVVESGNREALMFYHAQGWQVKPGGGGAPGTIILEAGVASPPDSHRPS